MGSSISARQKGDNWQALFFLSKATKLVTNETHVESVWFEKGPKGFDDVSVHYFDRFRRKDLDGGLIKSDYYQNKWHVSAGNFGWEDLADPKFINATSSSLLNNLKNAVISSNAESRFTLVTTDRIKDGDALENLLGSDSGEILLNRLFDGTKTDKSKMGKIRKAWRDHLDVNDDELRNILMKFRIHPNARTIDQLTDALDISLQSIQFIPVDRTKSVEVYGALPWKWHSQGNYSFDKTMFNRLCSEEGLVSDDNAVTPHTLGIRTFSHPINDLVKRTDEICDLQSLFDGRKIRRVDNWQFSVAPKVTSFLQAHVMGNEFIRLIIDAHVSVAVTAGAALNIKSGKKVEIEQRSNGQNIWFAPSFENTKKHTVNIESIAGAGTTDVVIEVSLSRNISSDVSKYILDAEIVYSDYIALRPKEGASSYSVSDGGHAFVIAENLVEECRAKLSEIGRNARFHLFFCGPNAVAFYFGQLAVPLGNVIIYEYDFEQSHGGGYSPSIALPI